MSYLDIPFGPPMTSNPRKPPALSKIAPYHQKMRGYFGKDGGLFWQGAILDGKSLTVQTVAIYKVFL